MMNFKDVWGITRDLFGVATYAAGVFSLSLFLLSLYPPLSFIPKFFVLFVLTH